MLAFEDVRFSRGGFDLAANFTVQGPGVVAVIGPSGGGKSTLLSLIAGFDAPTSGKIAVDGVDLARAALGDRPVSILFQDNNLFPHLDVLANVALGAEPTVHPSPDTLDRAREALERVGLKGFELRKPGDMSGGQQSRAALARVLLTDRRIVLMDEAFSALGPALRVEMLDLVRDLLPKALVLMVTHDPEDARRIADQVIFVEGGDVHAPQPTDDLFDNPSPAMQRYLA